MISELESEQMGDNGGEQEEGEDGEQEEAEDDDDDQQEEEDEDQEEEDADVGEEQDGESQSRNTVSPAEPPSGQKGKLWIQFSNGGAS